jgi:hypothetical protein
MEKHQKNLAPHLYDPVKRKNKTGTRSMEQHMDQNFTKQNHDCNSGGGVCLTLDQITGNTPPPGDRGYGHLEVHG